MARLSRQPQHSRGAVVATPAHPTGLSASAQGVLLAGHLAQGHPKPGDLVKGSVPLGREFGDLRSGLGEFGVLALDPGGQVPDPGRQVGGASLGDLMPQTALDFRLEPVPLIADPAELGPRYLQVGGQLAALAVVPALCSRAFLPACPLRAASTCSRTPSA